jgi:hypothetical protein
MIFLAPKTQEANEEKPTTILSSTKCRGLRQGATSINLGCAFRRRR